MIWTMLVKCICINLTVLVWNGFLCVQWHQIKNSLHTMKSSCHDIQELHSLIWTSSKNHFFECICCLMWLYMLLLSLPGMLGIYAYPACFAATQAEVNERKGFLLFRYFCVVIKHRLGRVFQFRDVHYRGPEWVLVLPFEIWVLLYYCIIIVLLLTLAAQVTVHIRTRMSVFQVFMDIFHPP